MRGAAARNLFKAWLLVALLAAAFGGLGWLLAELRGAVLFAFCSLLAASAAYAVGTERSSGCSAHAVRARRGSATPVDDRPAGGPARSLAAKAAPDRRHVPRAFAVGRGPRGATIAISAGLPTALSPPEVRGVLAHELAHVRSRDVAHADLRRPPLDDAARADAARRVSLAVPPHGALADRRGVHASAAVAEARTGGGRGRRAPGRSARSRRRSVRLDRAAESSSSTPPRRPSPSTRSALSTTPSAWHACS